ncbi:matrixin family metalloprotease, partial [Chloroflexota bacterium]
SVLHGDDDSGGGLNALLVTTLPVDGTYQIQAGRNGLVVASNEGDYSMTLNCQAAGGPMPGAANPVSATIDNLPIACNSLLVNSMDANAAYDNWWVDVPADHRVRVAAATADTGDVDPYLRVRLPDGSNRVDDDSGGGRLGFDAVLEIDPAPAGRYEIETGQNSGEGEYLFAVECIPILPHPPAPGNNNVGGMGQQQPIQCGSTVGSTINQATFYDEWQYSATVGESVTVDMVATNGNLDTYIDILAGPNQWMISNDDAGGATTNSSLTYVFPQSGWYTFRAGRYGDAAGVTEGDYDLTLTCHGVAQGPANPPANQPGGNVGGNANSGPVVFPGPGFPGWVTDQGVLFCQSSEQAALDNNVWYYQWWFDGVAGQYVNFAMNRTSGDLDPYLVIILPDGTWIEVDDTVGSQDAEFGLTLPMDGTYALQTTRYDRQFGPTTGGFELSIACQSGGAPPGVNNPPIAPANPPVSAGNQNPGSGPVIFPGGGFPSWVVDQGLIFCQETVPWTISDATWYWQWSFDGVAGQQVSFSMAATSGDLDPYLVIIRPDGSWYWNDDFGGTWDAQIDMTLPLTGTYTIQTTRLDRHTGPTSGNFDLSVACVSGGALPGVKPGSATAPASNAGQSAGSIKQGGGSAPIPGAVHNANLRPFDHADTPITPWTTYNLNVYLEDWENVTEALAALEETIGYWSANTAFQLMFVNDRAQADIVIQQPGGPVPAGDLSAVTVGEFMGRQYVQIDFTDDGSLGLDPQQHSIALVMIHAMGHALGLEHTPYADALLYPMYEAGRSVNLTASDTDQLVALYGPTVLPNTTLQNSVFTNHAFRMAAGQRLIVPVPYPNGVSSAGNGSNLHAICAVEHVMPLAANAVGWDCSWLWDDANQQALFTIVTTGDGYVGGRMMLLNGASYRLVDTQTVTVPNGQTQQVQLNAPAGTVVIETVKSFNPAGAAGFGYGISAAPAHAVQTSGGVSGSSVQATLSAYQPVIGYYGSAFLPAPANTTNALTAFMIAPNQPALYFGSLTTYQPNGGAGFGVNGASNIQGLSMDPARACSVTNPQAAGLLCAETWVSTQAGNVQSYAEVSSFLLQEQ